MDDKNLKLVPVEQAEPPKLPRHNKVSSKPEAKAVPCCLLGVKKVRAAATMGPGSGEVLVDPSNFLHKKERELPPPTKATPKPRLKDPLPKRSDRPLMGLSSGKDFLTSNVAEAAVAPPRYQAHEEVRYVLKPWFGEVPPYLARRRKELEAAKQWSATRDEQETAGEGQLKGAELEELVRHLKLKWQSVNEAYQRLPCVLDTPSKRRRKEEMESQLAEIERDVKLLSKATVVQVV